MPKSKRRKPKHAGRDSSSARRTHSCSDVSGHELSIDIRPIETRYAGHLFRSRLEARWAVFFDRLGIRWEYEPEGYRLDGRPYLPDFKIALPDGRILFVEVKHAEVDHFEGEHVDLCRSLARTLHVPVLLLTGPPAYRLYHQFTPELAANAFMAVFFTDHGPMVNVADDYWFAQTVIDKSTGVLAFPHDEHAARKSFGRELVDAVHAARQARFEHGAKP